MATVTGGPAVDEHALDLILAGIKAEILRAITKHGDNAMASPNRSVGDRLGILGEEVGEVAEEATGPQEHMLVTALAASFGRVARRTTYDNADAEALNSELEQTAAMAVSWRYANEMARRQ